MGLHASPLYSITPCFLPETKGVLVAWLAGQAGRRSADPAPAPPASPHAPLQQVKGVLGGLLASLRDFGFATPSAPICVTGNNGVVVGQAGVRERMAEALAAAAPAMLGCVAAAAWGRGLTLALAAAALAVQQRDGRGWIQQREDDAS